MTYPMHGDSMDVNPDALSERRRRGDLSYLGFGLCLAVLIAAMGFALVTLNDSHRDVEWVQHTEEVKINIHELMLAVLEAQTAKRGYIITDDGLYLSRYRQAIDELAAQVDLLRSRTIDNPAQQRRIDNLERILQRKIGEMAQAITARERDGFDAAVASVQAARPAAAMDQARAVMREMLDEEERLLRLRSDEAAQSRWATLTTMVAGVLIGVLTAGFSVWRIRREFEYRRTAHRAVRESQERLSQAQDAAQFGVFDWDIAGDAVYSDRRYAALFDIDPGRPMLTRGDWLDHVHPEDRERAEHEMNQTLEHGQPYSSEFRIVRPDGSVRWVASQATVSRDENDSPVRAIGVVADITDRKQAEIALKTSRDFTRMWLNECTDGVWDWNLETDEKYMSPGFKRLFGYDDDELPNHADAWREILHPDDHETVLQAFREHTCTGAAYNIPVRYRHKDGSLVWVIRRGVAIRDQSGRFTRMIGTHTDISRLKRVEAELQRARDGLEATVRARTADLRRTNEELEQFAYAASHDLKTPVVTFLGFLNMLQGQLDAGDADGVHDSVQRMQRAAVRMQRLIDDLLEISRIGRVVSESERVTIADLVLEFIEVLGPALAEQGVRIEIEDSAPVVYGDPIRLRQVVHNLLTNAIKYGCGETGGVIHVGGRAEDDATCFYVRDEGPGIDVQYQDKIFGLFQRLDSSTDGTGVGLAIVRRAIECQGGRVWVESQPGRGATFWVAMPDENTMTLAA